MGMVCTIRVWYKIHVWYRTAIDGQIVYLRGTLTLGCADNLAANLMAGYKSLTKNVDRAWQLLLR